MKFALTERFCGIIVVPIAIHRIISLDLRAVSAQKILTFDTASVGGAAPRYVGATVTIKWAVHVSDRVAHIVGYVERIMLSSSMSLYLPR